MNRCEIIGNKDYYTTGVFAKYCDVIMNQCVIHNHTLGGIHYLSNNRFHFRMINSKVINNDKVGISSVGDGAETRVEDS